MAEFIGVYGFDITRPINAAGITIEPVFTNAGEANTRAEDPRQFILTAVAENRRGACRRTGVRSCCGPDVLPAALGHRHRSIPTHRLGYGARSGEGRVVPRSSTLRRAGRAVARSSCETHSRPTPGRTSSISAFCGFAILGSMTGPGSGTH